MTAYPSKLTCGKACLQIRILARRWERYHTQPEYRASLKRIHRRTYEKSRPVFEKTCTVCEKPFQTAYGRAVVCGPDCRYEHQRLRVLERYRSDPAFREKLHKRYAEWRTSDHGREWERQWAREHRLNNKDLFRLYQRTHRAKKRVEKQTAELLVIGGKLEEMTRNTKRKK